MFENIVSSLGFAFAFFIFLLVFERVFVWFAEFLGFFAIVQEGTCHVYVLFGKVVGVLKEPGLNFLWAKIGLKAFIVRWFGKRHVVDLRLHQRYLRSLPVNSEEGAPMGIGVWYEMFISDPVSYLFKNANPEGSLQANVTNATVRCLGNMPVEEMLETRHIMSRSVRADVSPKSHEWGYQLGSVYIRKVHFRDANMILQIEEKVVNRLRQVTSAILQGGKNQVDIITSGAERKAAVAFAQAQAMRPQIVGKSLQQISEDSDVADTMFDILELQELLASNAEITLVPKGQQIMSQLLAAQAIVSTE
ncbi:MAG: regulator of protease activity HflC (stomatin/prohibitin superfamily) [Cellvibrionaceae bacterium]|jgi:regulator of protease activity HflC (stomatin/prohibitin superfamily)